MSCRTALIYGDHYHDYRFNDEHPFNPLRLQLTVELINACGLLDPSQQRPPRMATTEELLTVHSPEYVAAVQAASNGTLSASAAARFGLGTEDVPIFPQMHEAASLLVGGSLQAAELVMSGQFDHAFNIGGGLHHAMRSLAAGFCIYNDIAVVCRWLVDQYGARVLYIDNDAHHGDGVQEIFYDTPEVLTLSFHETGRYLFPGTGAVHERGRGAGYGYALNAPLDAFTDDDSWVAGYEQIVPAVVAAYHPDVIVLQNGCDPHFLDPLTHLHATTRSLERVCQLTHELAHRYCNGRLIALGGGGYDIWCVVPRAWTLIWAELTGQEVPVDVPQEWLERWQPQAPCPLPHRLRDAPGACPPIPRVREVTANNAATFARLMNTAIPQIQARPK